MHAEATAGAVDDRTRQIVRDGLGSVPPTPGEAAAASTRWERRGPLARLVRVDRPLPLSR